MSQLIKTNWFDSVDRECPFKNDYPRPQLRRESWQCLNGQYDYAFTCENSDVPEKWEGKILVPFAPECQLSGVEKHLEADRRMWYRRFFTLGDEFKGKRTLLNFGAVDWQCEVFVNSVPVGNHTGGYVPFSLDITDALKDGENELVVRVYDPTDSGWQQRGKQTHESHGFWYTPTSGIWQTVWLEPVNNCYIKNIRLVPDIDKGVVKLDVACAPCECNGKLYAKVLDGEKTVFDGEISAKCEIPVPDAKLWSPENPFLYDLKVTLDCGCCKDEVTSYFGMRKFGIAEDEKGLLRLTLNNKPYFQRGLLDQGYWPDGGMTAPCDEALIFDIQKMKDLGFNMLRKHIKVEPLRWYYHCDKIGMIVWQDMVAAASISAISLPVFFRFSVSTHATICIRLSAVKRLNGVKISNANFLRLSTTSITAFQSAAGCRSMKAGVSLMPRKSAKRSRLMTRPELLTTQAVGTIRKAPSSRAFTDTLFLS